MKYELIKWDFCSQSATDEQGNYSVKVTIAMHPTDGIAADFSNANDTPIESGAETFGEEVTSIWTENDEPIDNALLGALGLTKQI